MFSTRGSAKTYYSDTLLDLDAEFTARHGNISAYLDTHGYEAYAEQNVGLYLDLVGGLGSDIVALSSGFMAYRDRIHPDYLALRQRVESSRSTFVLLPSADVETCVNEIVRRQTAASVRALG